MGKKSRERRDKRAVLELGKQISVAKSASLLADKLIKRVCDHIKVNNIPPRGNGIWDCCPIPTKTEIVLTTQDSYTRNYEKKFGDVVHSPINAHQSVIDDTNLPCLPPFEDCFVEYDDTDNYPIAMYKGEHVITGVKFSLFEATEEDQEQSFIGNNAKWWASIHSCTVFKSSPEIVFKPVFGAFDSDGYLINLEVDDSLFGTGDENEEEALRNACIALFTFSLLHCRNIELVDQNPDAELSRIHQTFLSVPLTKYKTLAIKPIGKRYESATDTKDYQGLMPLHLRRGNFAHYTEDAPLFGKYTGTFWRPATAVGEAKNGTVIKDYKVMTNEHN